MFLDYTLSFNIKDVAYFLPRDRKCPRRDKARRRLSCASSRVNLFVGKLNDPNLICNILPPGCAGGPTLTYVGGHWLDPTSCWFSLCVRLCVCVCVCAGCFCATGVCVQLSVLWGANVHKIWEQTVLVSNLRILSNISHKKPAVKPDFPPVQSLISSSSFTHFHVSLNFSTSSSVSSSSKQLLTL